MLAVVLVVSAGVKSLLDVPATSELLETLGIPVWGYRTSELPAFFTDGSGIALEHRFDDDASAMQALLSGQVDAIVEALRSAAALPCPNRAARAAAEEHDVRRQAEKVEAILERAARGRRA